MYKRGLIGTITLIVLAILILGGIFTYYQVKKHGLQISSGNIVVDIKFNETKNETLKDKTNGIINKTNITLTDSPNNSSLKIKNISNNNNTFK